MNDRCVLFFGDSFVAGAGDEDGLGWPGRLAAAAWAAGLPLTAYNLGVRGENTREVARRFRQEARPRLIPGADNRVVLAVGANDVSLDAEGEPALVAAESVRLMSELLDWCEERQISAMVLGPGPADIADHDERARALGERFEGLCRERGVRFVEVLDELLASEAWTDSTDRRDGIHPAAEGYAALAHLLEPIFLDWLRNR